MHTHPRRCVHIRSLKINERKGGNSLRLEGCPSTNPPPCFLPLCSAEERCLHEYYGKTAHRGSSCCSIRNRVACHNISERATAHLAQTGTGKAQQKCPSDVGGVGKRGGWGEWRKGASAPCKPVCPCLKKMPYISSVLAVYHVTAVTTTAERFDKWAVLG